MSIFKHEYHEDKSDEYATPRWFFDPIAEAVGGFDLDPAAGAEEPGDPLASTRFTEEDDGLEQDWSGHPQVWMNPPFSEKEAFLRRFLMFFEDGEIELGVVLLPVDTSTDLFHELVAAKADYLFFMDGRLSFDGGGGRNRNPNFAVMLAIYGDPPDDLLELLSHRGTVIRLSDRYERSSQATLSEACADGGDPRD